jgi:hypothetical protein
LRRGLAAGAFAEAGFLRGQLLAALDVRFGGFELGEDRVDLRLFFGAQLALLGVCFRLDRLAGLIQFAEPGLQLLDVHDRTLLRK